MYRPNINPRALYNEYTAGFTPMEKKLLNATMIGGVAVPTIAGTVDMYSGPENVSNSNEGSRNAGITALVPGLASAGLAYSTMKLSNTEGYADRKVYGDDNGNVTDASRMKAANQYGLKHGAAAGAERMFADRNAAFIGRRNRSAAFGAGLGIIAGGAAASQMMMDEYPPSVANSLSMQDRQELIDLLDANGAL